LDEKTSVQFEDAIEKPNAKIPRDPQQEANDNAIIEEVYEKLLSQIREYRPTASLDMVSEALKLAKEAHKEQYRVSGEPYVIHPLEVAVILAEIRADLESITAALLHDVVEDTNVTEEELSKKFGPDVALLVAGVTKIASIKYQSKTDVQAENYRKMFFHMSEDVRVLLIKIADRLHNMRTIEVMPEEKQIATAQETLDIYAPLAHRLGVAKLRYDLEDLAFKYSDRALYNNLSKQVALKTAERIEITEQIMKEIRAALEAQGVMAVVEGRAKRLYSVYKKMVSKNRTLDQINDLYAVRILVKDIADCYAALGCVNGLYPIVPGRIKDYIAGKKPNGYQSLHTTLVGPGEPFEVQIRSFEMHEVAEFGIAAHWKYKEGGKAAKDKWLQEIMDWQHEISDSDEFLSALRMDLSAFQSHISCFTPKGEPINLVTGSCAIDFAYAIHSAVGNRMVGARVNGKLVPIDHVLSSGDIVEIVTSQNVKGPSKDWLKIVKTNQARTKINQWFNKENREDNLQKGRDALERCAEEFKIPLEELLAEGRDKDVMARFNCKEMEQLYIMIGTGGLKEKQVANHLYREYEKVQPLPSDEELISSLLSTGAKITAKGKKSGVVIKGVGDTAVTFSKCCNPVPGDEILGFVTRGRGLTVHRTDCINVLHMNELDRRRIISAQWNVPETTKQTYLVNLRITCPDGNNLLYAINDVLKDENIKVTSLTANVVQADAIFTMGIDIYDTDHMNHIINRLRAATNAHKITRIHT
jgi:GTP pyrophosphokinase